MGRLVPTGRVARWAVLAIWIAAAAALVPFGKKLPGVTNDDYVLPSGSQTARLQRILHERFPGGDQRTAVIVYRRAGGLTPADRGRMVADARRAASIRDVGSPVPGFAPGAPPGLVSARGDVALTVVPLIASKVFHITPTIDALRAIDRGGAGLEVHVTGFPALVSDVNSGVRGADFKLLAGTALLVLLLLIAVYRSPVLALVPIVVVAIAYAATTGLIYLLNDAFDLPVDTTSRSLLLVLMFGAGTDYCLLVVARYRAALVTAPTSRDALRDALPDAAPAILASGFTVVAAMLAMLGAVFGILRTVGPINALGIGMVLLASLTLLPALLAVLGRFAFWPHRSGAHPDEDVTTGVWSRIGRIVRRRPLVWLVTCTAVLGILAAGLTTAKLHVSPILQFRNSADSAEGYRVISRAFPPGAGNPTTVLVDRAAGPLRPADLRRVAALITATPGVAGVLPAGRTSRDGRAATMTLVFADDPFLAPALRRVQQIRREVATLAPQLTVLLGEGSAERADYRGALRRDTKVVVPVVLLVVFLAFVVLLRALVAPLYLLATVLLSFAAALGLSLFLFTHVFHASVDPIVPVLVFIFLVALGADYNIFLMSRAREEALEDSTRDGMLRALVATGPVITSAGIILAGTFALLIVMPLWVLLEIGFAVAVGILLDTFLVRTLCVPAVTWLLDERCWWPSKPRPGERRVLAPRGKRTPA